MNTDRLMQLALEMAGLEGIPGDSAIHHSGEEIERVLFGIDLKAAELVRAGQFGMMTSVRGTEIVAVPLEQALRKPKTVDEAFYQEVSEFFVG